MLVRKLEIGQQFQLKGRFSVAENIGYNRQKLTIAQHVASTMTLMFTACLYLETIQIYFQKFVLNILNLMPT